MKRLVLEEIRLLSDLFVEMLYIIRVEHERYSLNCFFVRNMDYMQNMTKNEEIWQIKQRNEK